MVQRVSAFADARGVLHPTAEAATVSDLKALFGNDALARQVLDKRKEIEVILDAYEALTTA